MRVCSNFIDLPMAVLLSQHHLLKKLSLPYCIFLPPLSKFNWAIYWMLDRVSNLEPWRQQWPHRPCYHSHNENKSLPRLSSTQEHIWCSHKRNYFESEISKRVTVLNLKGNTHGIPWWSSHWDSELLMQGGGASSVPGWGPKLPLALWCNQKTKFKKSIK